MAASCRAHADVESELLRERRVIDELPLCLGCMWVLIAGALVMFTQTGFAILGLAQSSGTILLKHMFDVCRNCGVVAVRLWAGVQSAQHSKQLPWGKECWPRLFFGHLICKVCSLVPNIPKNGSSSGHSVQPLLVPCLHRVVNCYGWFHLSSGCVLDLEWEGVAHR